MALWSWQRAGISPREFQSLVRAYKRSDISHMRGCALPEMVSIPRSGLQAFRLASVSVLSSRSALVSIPRSGLQAFRQDFRICGYVLYGVFQSLVRAYKRSDAHLHTSIACHLVVSIPRSGLQAFRRRACCRRTGHLNGFNPSFGLTSVPTLPQPWSSSMRL